jgi:hypothetical protein
MTNLSDRDLNLRQPPIVAERANPIVSPGWIVAVVIAALIVAALIYSYSGMRIGSQPAAPSQVITSPTTPQKTP